MRVEVGSAIAKHANSSGQLLPACIETSKRAEQSKRGRERAAEAHGHGARERGPTLPSLRCPLGRGGQPAGGPAHENRFSADPAYGSAHPSCNGSTPP